MLQAALGSLIEEELSPSPSLTTDEELAQYVRAVGESIYHPVGTCAMGPAVSAGARRKAGGPDDVDGMAVVCPRLKVHGVKGLRVVDASVMPTIVSGNTNAATIMVAEKGSDMILQDAASFEEGGDGCEHARGRRSTM